jgi:hypothetical protein
VTARKQNVLQDAAAAAAFAEAGEHDTARRIMARAKAPRKILVIGREDYFSSILCEYALGMAKRLDFELVALNISTVPLSMPADRRAEAIALFQENARRNVVVLQEEAEKYGIVFTHLMEIGEQDTVVATLHARVPGLRYVLIEPDPQLVQKAKGRVAIPVFDLGTYQGMSP